MAAVKFSDDRSQGNSTHFEKTMTFGAFFFGEDMAKIVFLSTN